MARRAPVAALLPALALLAGCSSGGGAVERQEQPPGVPVTVARAVRRDAPRELRAIGTVEAYTTVAVKAQVEGQLARVNFVEGQEVKRTDLLFTIDSRPFEAALRQAEAALDRDRVQAENARIEAHRREPLLREGVLSKDEYEQAATRARSLEAAVKADQAAVERARLELEYCTIRSPVDGRVGQLLVHEGNLVKANETTLAVVNQIRPVHVGFAVPQQELPAIRRFMAEGSLPVEATVPGTSIGSPGGVLVFVNNTVDAATGTVLLKARFPNQDEQLWPGQLVDVALRLAIDRDRTVIPGRAVQTGQQGKYVFVVQPEGTVALRPVVVGQTVGDDVVVEEGVAPGEVVVTEGQLRLAPGTRVEVKEAVG